MSNTQSKELRKERDQDQDQAHDDYAHDDYYHYFQCQGQDQDHDYTKEELYSESSNKLVLKLEEADADDDATIVKKCYVIYDHSEGEYFICGMNFPSDCDSQTDDYKFYCKKRKNVASFLKYLLAGEDTKINHVLCNYKGMYDFVRPCDVDYYVFEEHDNVACELTGYDGAGYSGDWLLPLLKTLKHVRY